MASARPYTYNISSNGAPGDWHWEVTSNQKIFARGVATTAMVARADAMRAALSHVGRRENPPAYPEDPSPSSPRFGAA
jgi:hypothetical protein